MKNDSPYDLIIIGGGSAGLTAADFAVKFGARVAIVEKHRIGGDCTWTGCIPSKTLLKTARVVHEMRSADRFGLSSFEPQIDLKAIMAHVHAVVQDIYQDESPEALRTSGIDVFLGGARFIDSHTLAVGETTLKARNFLIATGAHPFTPPIEGIEDVEYLTYEQIWNMDSLPHHLIVLGAGPVGCEMAQAFRRLGAEVTLIEEQDRILTNDDPAASQALSQVLEEEGINLLCGVKIERTWQDDAGIHLSSGEDEFVGDRLLVAVGRHPNVDHLGLKKAGVLYSSSGIQTDHRLRTSQRHIFAAGDVTGGYQFTHYAGWQAAMAVRNALLPGTSKGVTDLVPWATFTDPEVAQAGLTEPQARDQFGSDVSTYEWPLDKIDRSHTEGDERGFMKLVYKKNGTLLGVTIVARHAGEMIHEWIVALEQGLKVGDLSNALHIYPTYSTASMQASAAIRVDQLLSSVPWRILRSLARLKR
jgi:pyruvate/2-oxoglutarate dehydrogenase complex dihydrolipoamide dehydrogenase (E3) component